MRERFIMVVLGACESLKTRLGGSVLPRLSITAVSEAAAELQTASGERSQSGKGNNEQCENS